MREGSYRLLVGHSHCSLGLGQPFSERGYSLQTLALTAIQHFWKLLNSVTVEIRVTQKGKPKRRGKRMDYPEGGATPAITPPTIPLVSSMASSSDMALSCCIRRCHSCLIADSASTRREWSAADDLLSHLAYCSTVLICGSTPSIVHHPLPATSLAETKT